MRDGLTKRLEGKAPAGRSFEDYRKAFDARFVVVSGAGAGIEIRLTRSRITLGRGPGVDVVLADDALSRQHAAFEFADGSFRVRDLGSTNGVEVNGRRVDASTLAPGDRVGLGDVVLQFVVERREDEPEVYEIDADLE